MAAGAAGGAWRPGAGAIATGGLALEPLLGAALPEPLDAGAGLTAMPDQVGEPAELTVGVGGTRVAVGTAVGDGS